MSQKSNPKNLITLRELFFEFLKIGVIGFGGGLAIIAIIQNYFVNQKKLISPNEFITGTSLSQFIGAFAVNTTYYIGRKLNGIFGGIISVISFLLPSFFAVIILTQIYKSHNEILNIKPVIEGIMPVIVAVLLLIALKFFVSSKSTPLITIITCLLTIPFLIFFENHVLSIIIGGLIYTILMQIHSKFSKNNLSFNTLIPLQGLLFPSATFSQTIIIWFTTPTLIKFSLVCLGIGLIFFGGGYSLAPIIQYIIVQKLKWISNDAFIIGMIISQITPGPFAVIVTFLGYYLYGILGAIISTVLVFLPSLIIMELLINFYDSYQRNPWIKNFVQGIGLVIGLMIIKLAVNYIGEFMWPITPFELFIFTASLILLTLGYSPAVPILGTLIYLLISNYLLSLF